LTPSQMLIILILLIVLPLALLPTIIAVKKNHPYKIIIILVNIFGGLLFGIGWIVALIWCFITPSKSATKTAPMISDELERLHSLRIKGALTESEFNESKRKILSQ
jgi:Superinfection immunity protein/Short C-terminal domain